MKVETNNETGHIKYKDYQRYQSAILELLKGDRIYLTVNDTIVFDHLVEFGVTTHVNITLQDKGEKALVLTDEQMKEAISEYISKLISK